MIGIIANEFDLSAIILQCDKLSEKAAEQFCAIKMHDNL